MNAAEAAEIFAEVDRLRATMDRHRALFEWLHEVSMEWMAEIEERVDPPITNAEQRALRETLDRMERIHGQYAPLRDRVTSLDDKVRALA